MGRTISRSKAFQFLYLDMIYIYTYTSKKVNKRQSKPKVQSRMDNPEKPGTSDTKAKKNTT